MNPANPDFSNRTASSPALFNRCVMDWFGDWTDDGLLQVCKEFTKFLDIQASSFKKDIEMKVKGETKGDSKKDKNRVDPKIECLSDALV